MKTHSMDHRLTRLVGFVCAVLLAGQSAIASAASTSTVRLDVEQRYQNDRQLWVSYEIDGRALELEAETGDSSTPGSLTISRDGRPLLRASFAAGGSSVYVDHRGRAYTSAMLKKDPTLVTRFDPDVQVSMHPTMLGLIAGDAASESPAGGCVVTIVTALACLLIAGGATLGYYLVHCNDYHCVFSNGSYTCTATNACADGD